ncbi:MAG: hydrogenase maturation protein [Rhodocyclaceae bacterium]|nr:hydrogenase maturation protein [Rhodocyclaceae bacterium]
MRILLLCHSFNGLSQRLYAELARDGHELSVELDIADTVTEEAVRLFAPEALIAPFLKRRIPESVWRSVPCLIVHPGVVGDRGPTALDWAIHDGETEWGVTVLQAEAEMDAGPIWAYRTFPMRQARKASLYRHEVTEAAVAAVREALMKLAAGEKPTPLERHPAARGSWRPAMSQDWRRIDWQRETTATIWTKINAADGFPGVADTLFGVPCHLFDAWPEGRLTGAAGELIARRETAICRATVDGAIWIGHVKRAGGFKLPATAAFAAESAHLAEAPLDSWQAASWQTWQDIRYEEEGAVGYLHFEFYNGAMSVRQCQRLQDAFLWAASRPTRVIVLMGGEDFWSNGIHLNVIEAAASPADESWRNIVAIDDLAEAILRCESHLTVAALRGNAGAGGCFLARACDEVWVREGVVLNPHYQNMGNLYGSEFWTYLLPQRVGWKGARAIMQRRLPMLAQEAVFCGFYDKVLPTAGFSAQVRACAQALVADFSARIARKRARRARDEAAKPLAHYRAEELAAMRQNFYGFDPSYHVARWHFVHKTPHSWTPLTLARHRRAAIGRVGAEGFFDHDQNPPALMPI